MTMQEPSPVELPSAEEDMGLDMVMSDEELGSDDGAPEGGAIPAALGCQIFAEQVAAGR